MNKIISITSCLFIWLTAALSLTINAKTYQLTTDNPADLPSEHIIIKITQSQNQQMQQRFQQHFGQFINHQLKHNDHNPIDYFDFLIDSATSRESFELKQWFKRAALQQIDLSDYQKYGFNNTQENNYSIDYNSAPHLTSFFELSKILLFSRQTKEHHLIPKGFRPEDIDIIENYIANNPLETSVNHANLTHSKQALPKLKQTFIDAHLLAPEQIINAQSQFYYQKNFLIYQQERNWIIKLLANLDKQRQRILKQVMVELINGGETINSTPTHSQTELFEAIRNGSLEKRIQIYEQQINGAVTK